MLSRLSAVIKVPETIKFQAPGSFESEIVQWTISALSLEIQKRKWLKT